MKKLFLFMCCLLVSSQVLADSDPFKSTPYPVPRFVSLAADEVHVRTGPGTQYPIEWVFKKQGLPVEVVLEYGNWRKIKDHEGQDGWVYGPLLSGKRTGLVQGQGNVELHDEPREGSETIAYIEPYAIVKLDECEIEWCEVEAGEYEGWLPKSALWGTYAHEKF